MTVRGWSAVIVEDFLGLREVCENGRGASGGTKGTRCAKVASNSDVSFNFVREGADCLGNLLLDRKSVV